MVYLLRLDNENIMRKVVNWILFEKRKLRRLKEM